jgi:hypothetical protein
MEQFFRQELENNHTFHQWTINSAPGRRLIGRAQNFEQFPFISTEESRLRIEPRPDRSEGWKLAVERAALAAGGWNEHVERLVWQFDSHRIAQLIMWAAPPTVTRPAIRLIQKYVRQVKLPENAAFPMLHAFVLVGLSHALKTRVTPEEPAGVLIYVKLQLHGADHRVILDDDTAHKVFARMTEGPVPGWGKRPGPTRQKQMRSWARWLVQHHIEGRPVSSLAEEATAGEHDADPESARKVIDRAIERAWDLLALERIPEI